MKRILILWFLLSVILSACTPQSSTFTTPGAFPLGKPTRLSEGMLRFLVDLPAGTPSGTGQEIDIVILDEVTGLVINPERYPMRMVDDTHYTINIPFQIGTIIKYRYERGGSLPAKESTSNGQPVRYRLYRVDGQATVNDIVARWSDRPYQRQTGRMQGTIIDGGTGARLPGLIITCGGMQTTTNADGSFTLDGLPAGMQNFVAYAKDGFYLPFQQGALIGDGTLTKASFSIPHPQDRVNVVFTTSFPAETSKMAQVRLAGNLSQMGNTFSDLPGGVNGKPHSMPVLLPLKDGRYGVSFTLTPGTDLHYKYTLGDGFWNAEHDLQGRFNLRHLIVPNESTIIKDEIVTWRDGAKPPLNYDYFSPMTPTESRVTIQFYSYNWAQEIPAWSLGNHRWTYTLYSPLEILPIDFFKHRFCVNGSCGEK